MSAPVTVTYFFEVLSSWCHWTEPAWDELRSRYAGRVDFRWRIALMQPADFPVSRQQCDWFYRRSGTHVGSPVMLHSGWFEEDRAGNYQAPNLVAEAGRDLLGESDDRLRRALSRAALLEGRRIGDLATAAAVGADATGLDAAALCAAAESDAVRARVDASTRQFFAHQLSQRPSFLLESNIGDKAVFSGTWTTAPLAASLDAMLEDVARYTSHAAHFGPVPAQ